MDNLYINTIETILSCRIKKMASFTETELWYTILPPDLLQVMATVLTIVFFIRQVGPLWQRGTLVFFCLQSPWRKATIVHLNNAE